MKTTNSKTTQKLTSPYLDPKSHEKSINLFSDLIKTIAKLRDPLEGCPWDLQQTHDSLLPYLIEEAYEVYYAFKESNLKEDQVSEKSEEADRNLAKHQSNELGDLLLQILLHSTIGHQENRFTINDVLEQLLEKMIRRHPHVFQPKTSTSHTIRSDSELKDQWEKIKKEETKYDLFHPLSDSSRFFPLKFLMAPSLESALKIGHASKKINFDWDDYHQVLYKVEEEWQELKEELPPGRVPNSERVEEEYGDLLFSMAQLGRHLNLDPEKSLHKASLKFIKRFQKIEIKAKELNISLESSSTHVLDSLWNEVKIDEKNKTRS